MIPNYENNLSSSDLLHNDSSFDGFTTIGEIKQGSITQCLSKDLEDATKENLDRIYIQNEDGNFHHNMERLSWYNTYEISIHCLRALPNRDGILKNGIFIEAVRYILGLPSHILQPYADGHHFVGRNIHIFIPYITRRWTKFKGKRAWAFCGTTWRSIVQTGF